MNNLEEIKRYFREKNIEYYDEKYLVRVPIYESENERIQYTIEIIIDNDDRVVFYTNIIKKHCTDRYFDFVRKSNELNMELGFSKAYFDNRGAAISYSAYIDDMCSFEKIFNTFCSEADYVNANCFELPF